MFTKSIFVAAALLIVTPAAATGIEPQADAVRVSSNGLDLNTDAGAEAMLGRIHKATLAVCPPQAARIELARHRVWTACMTATQSHAIAALGNAKVSDMASSQHGKTEIAAR
jgi:UrcA family protein